MSRDTDKYDFFVSYARKDNENGWITLFIGELLSEHNKFTGNDPSRQLIPFFDKEDIRSFDDWQDRIHQGVAKSRLFLSFLSPNYFASEWCQREWKTWIDSEIAKHILSQGAAPIYFVEVPGFIGKVQGLEEQATLSEALVAKKIAELCGLSPPHDIFNGAVMPILGQIRNRRQVISNFVKPFQDEGIAALRRNDLHAVLVRLAQDLDHRVEDVKRAALSENTVPAYNKKFSGRLEELFLLRERLKDDRAGVISGVHGLGGIGKTELALTYAHAFAGAYPGGRFEIRCEGKLTLKDAILSQENFIAFFRKQISDEERKSAEKYFAAVIACLRDRIDQYGHILLILDNVTEPLLLRTESTDDLTFLGPKLHLLATTRLAPPTGSGISWHTLGELPENDALELLEKHRPFTSPDERDAARSIVKRLGGFTLAIELVAAWLSAHKTSSSYSKLAEGIGLEDLEEIAIEENVSLRHHNHEQRLSAILGPVLSSLKPAERRALEFASQLPPDGVPLSWLKSLVAHYFPEMALDHKRIDPWKELVGHMVSLALFTYTQDEGTGKDDTTDGAQLVRVHRLIQDLVKKQLTGQEKCEQQELLLSFIRELNAKLENTTQWKDSRWELEPLEALAIIWADININHSDSTWLLNQVGLCWIKLAEWVHAEPLMRCALRIDEHNFGLNHHNVARDLNNLAQILHFTNRLGDAESMMRRALDIIENSLGVDHPMVAIKLNNLAALLTDTNRLADAEHLVRRALIIDEQHFGMNHPRIATDLNSLAQVLQATNRLSEAEPLMWRALQIDEQNLGLGHPNIAIRLNNLAVLLKITNRLAKANLLMRRALAINEQSFGLDHPNVARDLNNLAQVLQATNQLAQAEPLMRRALEIEEKSSGLDHPRVATILNNLAQLLEITNRQTEAEILMWRALQIDEQSLGQNHPKVSTDLMNLAHLLQARNELTEAEPLMRRALEIDKQSFGLDHPKIATDLNGLAQVLQATNRLGEAETLMRRTLEIDELGFGPDHPRVATDLSNLALLLQTTKRVEEAETLMRRAVKILLLFSVTNGSEHPYLQKVTMNFITLLQAIGYDQLKIQEELDQVGKLFNIQYNTWKPLSH